MEISMNSINEKGFIQENLKKAREAVNQDTCIICGKNMTGNVINSHTVPQFILKNISFEHTYISSYQYELKPIKNTTLGIKKAGVFRYLCGKCDTTLFKTYETEKNYEDLSQLQRILIETAFKNHFKKYYDISSVLHFLEHSINTGEQMIKESKNIVENQFRQRQIYEVKKIRSHQLNLLGRITKDTNKIYSEMICDNSDNFRVIYSEFLNYTVPIAAQGCFPHGRALDVGNDKPQIRRLLNKEGISMVNLAVFPFKEKTLILLFCRNDVKQYNKWINQFKKKPEDQKLYTINNLIFTELDDYYVDKNSEIKIEVPEVEGVQTFENLSERRFKFDNYLSEKYKI